MTMTRVLVKPTDRDMSKVPIKPSDTTKTRPGDKNTASNPLGPKPKGG